MTPLYACNKFDWERFVLSKPLPRLLKLLAVTMSVYADADGGSVHPGEQLLAEAIGLSPRRMRPYLHALRDDLGLIELVQHGGGQGRRLADEYQLVVPPNFDARLAAWIHRTVGRSSRPQNAADTPDTGTRNASGETGRGRRRSTHTPDVSRVDTPDVSRVTPDVVERQSVAHQSPTPTTDQSSSRSTTATDRRVRASAGKTDSSEVADARAFGAARQALTQLGPDRYAALLAKADSELGDGADLRTRIMRAAELAATA